MNAENNYYQRVIDGFGVRKNTSIADECKFSRN